MIADWQVFPRSQWNYALDVNPASAATAIKVTESAIGVIPFSRENPPITVAVPARKLPAWLAEDGVAAAPPQSPVAATQPAESITLIPYAAAKLRITAFPMAKS
jgi:uncharacterized protein